MTYQDVAQLHVRERDDEDGATMLVVGLPSEPATDYYVTEDGTVADYNAANPDGDPVVECVYPQRTDVDLPERRDAFPRSRLELVAPTHDRDSDNRGPVVIGNNGP